ncbi:hypothetical protein ACFQMA_21630 [Halosimplex aquaticum]|uniref:DUF7344 domain-containing protein n=1 Tax=Halosimplex aquaticum TaxID=3026162 RepID=A0ABD5Y6B8_9EURY|nr:hypothetical protein [Halosimplex aquaticum]
MTPTDGTLRHSDKSLVYDALSSSRRRDVVRLLDDAEAGLRLRDLAEAVAERELEDGADDEQVKRVQASLYHVHIPKLADAGIVRYREGSDQVRLTQAVTFDAIDVLGE